MGPVRAILSAPHPELHRSRGGKGTIDQFIGQPLSRMLLLLRIKANPLLQIGPDCKPKGENTPIHTSNSAKAWGLCIASMPIVSGMTVMKACSLLCRAATRATILPADVPAVDSASGGLVYWRRLGDRNASLFARRSCLLRASDFPRVISFTVLLHSQRSKYLMIIEVSHGGGKVAAVL